MVFIYKLVESGSKICWKSHRSEAITQGIRQQVGPFCKGVRTPRVNCFWAKGVLNVICTSAEKTQNKMDATTVSVQLYQLDVFPLFFETSNLEGVVPRRSWSQPKPSKKWPWLPPFSRCSRARLWSSSMDEQPSKFTEVVALPSAKIWRWPYSKSDSDWKAVWVEGNDSMMIQIEAKISVNNHVQDRKNKFSKAESNMFQKHLSKCFLISIQ